MQQQKSAAKMNHPEKRISSRNFCVFSTHQQFSFLMFCRSDDLLLAITISSVSRTDIAQLINYKLISN